MGRLVREMDWSATPLGAIERWPQSLLTSVSLCLDCAFPILIWWGPELVMIYNDEYRSVLGSEKHPAALGAAGRAVFPELWDVIGPMLTQVVETGQATRSRDLLLLMNRDGFEEETYFSFSYSPIRDESGGVGGVFTPVLETTGKVVGERRLRTLRELAALGGADSVGRAAADAASVLAQADKDIPFAAIYKLDSNASNASLLAAAGVAAGSPSAPFEIEMAPGLRQAVWPLGAMCDAGLTIRIDVQDNVAILPTGAWGDPPNSVLLIPIFAATQDAPIAALVAGANPKRPLDDEHRGFFELVAKQIGNSFADAMALEEERKRAAALAELDQAKTLFFSNVSHEFRTPLTLMLGPLEGVLSDAGGLPAEARKQIEVAHRNGLRLLKLVNALLDFSRIEAGRLKASFEAVDLGALTAELAGSFRSLIEGAGLRFRVEMKALGEPVYLDADLWEKIVLNLLSNAFKYTFDGEIRVETRRSRDGRSAQLLVSDTGVGIPHDELPRLFERFHRVEGSRGRSFEGTGIGLALVQELVRLHGGAVDVASEVDVGTTFTVTIPLGSAHLPAGLRRERSERSPFVNAPLYLEEAATWIRLHGDHPLSVASPASDVEGGSVIVADDNADMRDFLRRLLTDEGLSVIAVEDGVAALEAARLQAPDAIVSDIMMPRLDGLGLLRAVRDDHGLKNIPFILLSARAGEDERVRGVASGADDYLSKPFSGKELVTRVATQIRLKRLRQEAFDAIAASEQRLRLAQEAGRIGAWQFDPRDKTISSQGSFSRLWGLEDSLSLGDFIKSVHVEDRARFESALMAAARDGVRLVEEFRLVRPDTRELVWLAARAERQVDGSGSAPMAVGVAFDITEQRLAETKLRQLNEYLKAKVEERTADRDRLWTLVGDLMLVARFDADIVAVNPAFTNVLGWKPEEMIGRKFLEFVHPDDLAATEAEAARLATGAILHRFENRYRSVSGEWRWIAWTAAPDSQFIHAVGRDVTDERLRAAKLESAEAQLRQAQKMEAVGQLTGGIAHDFNNLLAALTGSLELIRRSPTDAVRVVRFAEAALQAAERGARLTSQLLTFSRSQDLNLVPVNVSDLVGGMADLLDRTLGPMIEVRLDLKDAGAAVLSDRTQLEMAILNLAINSRDAMPNGGRVTIESRLESIVDDAELAGGEFVVLSVADNGPGMPPDVIARAFDPFFTTKGIGKGTGLGLSQVYGLTKRSHGAVRIDSAPGEGTAVRMYLPVAGALADPCNDAGERFVEGGAGGSVLIVDDDPDVRRVLVSSLQALGYAVTEAATGVEALEALKSTRPDWLVVDFATPGMNGAQLAAAAWERYPELPTLLISGYADTAAIEAAVGPNLSILHKPFLMADLQRALAHRVRRALRRR